MEEMGPGDGDIDGFTNLKGLKGGWGRVGGVYWCAGGDG